METKKKVAIGLMVFVVVIVIIIIVVASSNKGSQTNTGISPMSTTTTTPLSTPVSCPSCPDSSISGPFQIYFPNKSGDRKCMDIGDIWTNEYGSFPCSAGNTNQQFYFKQLQNGKFQIRNYLKTECLDSSDAKWNFKPCVDDSTNQQFRWKYTGTTRNIGTSSDQCLDVANNAKNYRCEEFNANQNLSLYGLAV